MKSQQNRLEFLTRLPSARGDDAFSHVSLTWSELYRAAFQQLKIELEVVRAYEKKGSKKTQATTWNHKKRTSQVIDFIGVVIRCVGTVLGFFIPHIFFELKRQFLTELYQVQIVRFNFSSRR